MTAGKRGRGAPDRRPAWVKPHRGYTPWPNELSAGLLRVPLGAQRDVLRTLWEFVLNMNRADHYSIVTLTDDDAAHIRLSRNQLGEAAGVSPASAQRAKDELVRLGHVWVRPGRGGQPDTYVLTALHYNALAELGSAALYQPDTELGINLIPSAPLTQIDTELMNGGPALYQSDTELGIHLIQRERAFTRLPRGRRAFPITAVLSQKLKAHPEREIEGESVRAKPTTSAPKTTPGATPSTGAGDAPTRSAEAAEQQPTPLTLAVLDSRITAWSEPS